MIFATLLGRSLARHKALVIPVAAILSAFQLLDIVVASNLQEQGLFEQFAALVPPFIQEAMGGAIGGSVVGSIALGFVHPLVMLSLSCTAIYIASEPAGEVEHGLVDLVLARAIPRYLIVTRSAVACLVGTSTVTIAMFVANRAAVGWLLPATAVSVPASRLLWVAANLLAIVWCFGAASLALASQVRERTRAAGTMALVAVFLYLLQFGAAAWAPLKPFARASPFHYYDAMQTLLGAVTPIRNIAVLMSATAVLMAVAYVSYSRRDL